MTLKQLNQPFKLNDIQNRPLVVLCAILIAFIIYQGKKADNAVAECRADRISLQSKNDSMSREQIVLYRTIAFQSKELGNADSLLRSKTQKNVEQILKNEKSKN